MKPAKHSKPLRAIQIALALLVALAASTAAAQSQQGGGRTPAPSGPSYGPVLDPQAVESESGAQLDQSPPGKDPAKAGKPSEQKKGARRVARRAAPQRVDAVPVVALDSPRLAPPPPSQPAPVVPGPAQINSCLGGICTDTSDTTYNTGAGNAALSSGGRLCTRSGNTLQCF